RLVLTDEAHAPGERVAPAASDARVDQRVEDPALRHPEAGHDRHADRGEELADVPGARAPGDAPAESLLGLIGDPHPLLAGVLPESVDAGVAGRGDDLRCRVLRDLRVGEGAYDEDLLA